MDFFTRQDQARRHTTILVFYFIAAVVLVVGTLNVVAAVITPFVSEVIWTWKTVTDVTHQSYIPPPPLFDPHRAFFHADIVAYVTVSALVVIGGGCLFKMHQLAAGGSAVAQMLGAKPVLPNTTDTKQRMLHDVVEEMAIASGIPPPALYLLSHEQGINAFAAGYSKSDAVVCVTQGCLDKLTRDELQAVIAHEFSHILNGDMSLNLKLTGALYGILLIGLIGYGMIRGIGNRTRTWTTTTERSQLQVDVTTSDGNGNGFADLLLPLVAGTVLIMVGYVGLFFGRLVQAAVCRQREYLADAAAAQFTRNPAALASALRKLGASSFGSRIDDHHAEQLAHMFFASSKGAEWDWFSTHPQVADRIRATDPSWDGCFPKPSGPTTLEKYSCDTPVCPEPLLQERLSPMSVAQTPPVPTPIHVQWASDFLSSVPPVLSQAARDPFSARALIFALLVSNEPSVRQRQLDLLGQLVDSTTLQIVQKLLGPADRHGSSGRRTLTDLAVPALRHLSAAQCQQFTKAVQAMVHADSRVTLYEYMLHKILVRYLVGPSSVVSPPQYFSFKPLLSDIQIVISALAQADQKPSNAAEEAFRRGWDRLEREENPPLLPSVPLTDFDRCLNRLSLATPVIKRRVVEACAYSVAADGIVETEEGEFLRAVTVALDCALPPLLTQNMAAGISAPVGR